MIEAMLVHIQQVQGQVRHRLGDVALGAHLGKVAHAAQQAVGDSRRATSASSDFKGAFRVQGQAEDTRRPADNGRQIGGAIEL